jgi:hypothetical protein
MSESEPRISNPFAQMFDLQRRTMEQSQQTFHQGMEFQKQMAHLAVDTVRSQRSMSRKSTDLARTAVEASLDSMEASMPGGGPGFDQLHAVVREQFDAVDDMNEEMWDAIERTLDENAEAYDEFVDRYMDTVDDATDVYVESVEEASERTESMRE